MDKSKGKVDLYNRPEEINVKRVEKVDGKDKEVSRTFYRSGVDEYTEFVRPEQVQERIVEPVES